ncbi:MAG: hypothetical protein J6T80_08505 [Paludibacteraceae bacterium]|nr:hypothetical protein [Paludibacteraceae bacterium]
MEVIGMGTLPGDDPLDDPIQNPSVPTRPNDFHATINGTTFSLSRLNNAIPSARATVVNASTGNVVLDQQFTNSIQQQINIIGVYILHIQTLWGALVGQFIVQ